MSILIGLWWSLEVFGTFLSAPIGCKEVKITVYFEHILNFVWSLTWLSMPWMKIGWEGLTSGRVTFLSDSNNFEWGDSHCGEFWVRRLPLWWMVIRHHNLQTFHQNFSHKDLKFQSSNVFRKFLETICDFRTKFHKIPKIIRSWNIESTQTGKQFVTLWNLFGATFKQCFETWQR